MQCGTKDENNANETLGNFSFFNN